MATEHHWDETVVEPSHESYLEVVRFGTMGGRNTVLHMWNPHQLKNVDRCHVFMPGFGGQGRAAAEKLKAWHVPFSLTTLAPLLRSTLPLSLIGKITENVASMLHSSPSVCVQIVRYYNGIPSN